MVISVHLPIQILSGGEKLYGHLYRGEKSGIVLDIEVIIACGARTTECCVNKLTGKDDYALEFRLSV